MWQRGWRDSVWSAMDQPWDMIIIGGGITGAGLLREAAQVGLRVLLLEARDFAFGTSSRSSKLVHGGFRYLRNGQISVTRESVREREWMLHQAPHLVTPLKFLLPSYASAGTPKWQLGLGVFLYDVLAPKWAHRGYSAQQLLQLCPLMNPAELQGGYEYFDSEMDDARLVLRVIREAVQTGGTALNYAPVERLLRAANGQVCGVVVRDANDPAGRTLEIQAKVVINAAGPWSDEVRSQVGAAPRLRKLRGSHLVFDAERFPLKQAVTLLHPSDNRAMFAFPWEGVTVIGTTDLDHPAALDQNEPFATSEEIDYMLAAARFSFPAAELTQADVLSTFSGLRPVINTGKASPSQESRAHVVWQEDGLITLTGGKLTIFHVMAKQALQLASSRLPGSPDFTLSRRTFDPLPRNLPTHIPVDINQLAYLLGRYGVETPTLLSSMPSDEFTSIHSLPSLWAELRWAAREEGVMHLDDLLLRRVRLGNLLPDGGAKDYAHIRSLVQDELGWDDDRWEAEWNAYLDLWQRRYSPAPGESSIPLKVDHASAIAV